MPEHIPDRSSAPDYRERVKEAVKAMVMHESGLIVCPDCGFGWDLVETITAVANGEDLAVLFQKWREHPSNAGRERP